MDESLSRYVLLQQSTTTRSYLRDKPKDRSLRHYQSFLLRDKPTDRSLRTSRRIGA